ncbi:MAG: hypothetical protein ABFS12_16870 [Bacteroidota bacterium]
MDLEIHPHDISWWFWFVTFLFIVAALLGYENGYSTVIVISAIQVFYFWLKEKSFAAFPTQIRIVYFLYTLFGLWDEVRFILFIILLIGTIMVTFFGRCSIALVLKNMPWNKERKARLN